MAIGGLIIGILCSLTAALLVLTTGAGWLVALAAYAVFGSAGLILSLLSLGGDTSDY